MNMTEELDETKMVEDQEEGEILEDGEIADDDEDIVPLDSGNGPTKDEKESGEGTKDKFTHYSSYLPSDRDDYFRPHKRRKKNHPNKKRKRGGSVDSKRKDRETIDINPYLNDSSFDNVELSDEEEYHFEQLNLNLILEILGCSIGSNSLTQTAPNERPKMVVRIVKIMKKLYGNDPDIAKRMVRLKRRALERRNSLNGKQAFKVPCKFYMEGKCHKGSDCNYSHDCPVPKKKELCKFFLQGFCGKGDDCLYMHGEFPCKFFHTNTKCFSGDKCRFSHAPLTPENREILRGYLDFGTFPDEYRPSGYRPSGHINNEWSSSRTDEPNPEFDVNESDIEQLLSKSRPVIIGEPTEKMKKSMNTWNWQLELKDCEKAYTGMKRNLFCIEDKFVIKEKPTTPKIEEDEEEIEAQIRNYYTDILDGDDYEEMIAIQEIEEHQRKMKEDEASKNTSDARQVVESTGSVASELSEEEKRLIEASAHDEDLRMLPHSFGLPSAFQNAAPAVSNMTHTPFENSYNHGSYFPPSDNFAPPFKPFSNTESDPANNEPNVGEITTSDVNSLVHQIRQNGNPVEQPVPVVPLLPTPSLPPISMAPNPVSVNQVLTTKPELRDPRLQRLKESGRLVSTPSSSSPLPTSTIQEEKTVNKPFIKICSPNVFIDYKLVLVKVSQINYSMYSDLYHNDNSFKSDPRLKKFFSNPPSSAINESVSGDSNSNEFFSSFKVVNENLITLPSLTMPTMATAANPQPTSKVPVPQEMLSNSMSSNSPPVSASITGSTINMSRDPRMRSKDPRVRSETNEQSVEISTAVSGPESEKQSVSVVPEQSEEKSNGDEKETPSTSNSTESDENNTTSDLSSMPSYAIAALPASRPLLSSLPTNLLYSSSDEQSNSMEASQEVTLNDKQEMTNNTSIQATILEDTSKKWTLNTENGADSDNEMEIDLQQPESEGDSENENELIIATSDPEDKECEQSSSDQLALCKGDYSVNC